VIQFFPLFHIQQLRVCQGTLKVVRFIHQGLPCVLKASAPLSSSLHTFFMLVACASGRQLIKHPISFLNQCLNATFPHKQDEANSHAQTNTRSHTHTHTNIHTHAHTRTRTHTHTHTHAHTHTHTHTHTLNTGYRRWRTAGCL